MTARKNSLTSSVSKEPTFSVGNWAVNLKQALPDRSRAHRIRASSMGRVTAP